MESPTVADWWEKACIFHGFSRKYRHRHNRQHFQWAGNVVWDISDEKYFHRFSNSYFEAYFLLDLIENVMFFRSKLDCYMRVHHDSIDKTYENHWNFWWNHAKIMVQNRSWKIDENIFHQKCPKQHSLVTDSVSGDARDDVSSENHEKSMLFLTSLPLWDSL